MEINPTRLAFKFFSQDKRSELFFVDRQKKRFYSISITIMNSKNFTIMKIDMNKVPIGTEKLPSTFQQNIAQNIAQNMMLKMNKSRIWTMKSQSLQPSPHRLHLWQSPVSLALDIGMYFVCQVQGRESQIRPCQDLEFIHNTITP